MNQNIKIADIISKLNETEDLLKDKKISEIDKDLILEKIRKMYEKILLGNSVQLHQETMTTVVENTVTAQPVVEEKIQKPIHPPAEKIELIENKEIVEPIIPEPEIITQESVTDEKKVVVNNPTLFDIETPATTMAHPPKKESVKEEVIIKTENKAPSKTLSDQYQSHSTKTVSDLISKSQSEKDLTSKIQLKPIKSIKSAISINDRIMFTKELFDNDPDFYNELVEKLNNMNNLTEAMEYLAIEIDLNEDSEAVQKFVELVHRRFA